MEIIFKISRQLFNYQKKLQNDFSFSHQYMSQIFFKKCLKYLKTYYYFTYQHTQVERLNPLCIHKFFHLMQLCAHFATVVTGRCVCSLMISVHVFGFLLLFFFWYLLSFISSLSCHEGVNTHVQTIPALYTVCCMIK